MGPVQALACVAIPREPKHPISGRPGRPKPNSSDVTFERLRRRWCVAPTGEYLNAAEHDLDAKYYAHARVDNE